MSGQIGRRLKRVFAASLVLFGPTVGWAQARPETVLSPSEVVDASDDREMRWPVAVATTEGQIAVADAFGARLLVFERVGVSWALEHEVVLPGVPVGLTRLDGAWILSLRGAKDLLVVDDAGRIAPPVPLAAGFVPGTLAAAGEKALMVYDAAAAAVVRLDRQGVESRRIAISGQVTALASTSDGGLLAAVGDQARVLRFDASGRSLAALEIPGAPPERAWPSGLAVEKDGRIFVADRHGGRLVVLDQQGRWIGVGGRQGAAPGLLGRPSGLARSPSGEIVAADLGNGRVQLFRPRSDAGSR